jgi:hypothetical protein
MVGGLACAHHATVSNIGLQWLSIYSKTRDDQVVRRGMIDSIATRLDHIYAMRPNATYIDLACQGSLINIQTQQF